jgi:cytochrome P450
MNSIEAKAFFSQDAIENPSTLYAQIRSIAAVCQIGEMRAFFVSSHAAVEEAVKRHEDFSANLNAMLVCGDDEKPYVLDLKALGATNNVIATADEPEHAVQRKLMLPPLKQSRIAELESELRVFARERVATFMRKGSGDICPALSESLPAYVVMKLLGLEGDDALEAIRRWAMMGGDFLAGRLNKEQMNNVFVESAALMDYLAQYFDEVQAREPGKRGESLTAKLVNGVEENLVTREQAIGILIILFGAAGESTASLLGSAIRLLAEDLSLQEKLRGNPSLIPNFIEEVVRLETPFKFHYRFVNHDTQLCGTVLKAGDVLMLGWASANRDPAVWEDADILKLDRERPERHFGFGYGIHFCIGAPLARLEVRVALEELLAGTKHIELDPSQPYAFAHSVFVRRMQHLHLLTSSRGKINKFFNFNFNW